MNEIDKFMSNEAQNVLFLDRVDRTGTVKRHYKGVDFPQKGNPTPMSVWAANQAKVLFIEGFKFFSKPQFIIIFVFTWNKIKFIEDLLERYIRITSKATDAFFNEPDYQREHIAPLAQEIEDLIYKFLEKIGIKDGICEHFSKIFSFIINIDSAYYTRLQDIFSETSKEQLMENPQKEIKRLLKLLQERDSKGISDKFKVVQRLFSLILWIPKAKKAFIETIKGSIFSKLQYDEDDSYWAHFRQDYKHFGKTLEERLEMAKKKGYNRPQTYPLRHFSAEEMDKLIKSGEIQQVDGMWMHKDAIPQYMETKKL